MGFFNFMKNKAEETAEFVQENHGVTMQVVELLKQQTATPAYRIKITEEKAGIFDSKFGGFPYWDKTKEYPVDEEGEKLVLLAQINFETAEIKDERLPKTGILQFFISKGDAWGLDFEVLDSSKNNKVIYHENIDLTVTEESLSDFGIPTTIDENISDEGFPVCGEFAIVFEAFWDAIGTDDYRFSKVAAQAIAKIAGDDLGDRMIWDYFSEDEYDYLYEALIANGHKIFGYPYFTQSDPREEMNRKQAEYYDTLLFQMDSEYNDERDLIMWGDVGVCNFFINSEALKNRDFSKVMYTWDCG